MSQGRRVAVICAPEEEAQRALDALQDLGCEFVLQSDTSQAIQYCINRKVDVFILGVAEDPRIAVQRALVVRRAGNARATVCMLMDPEHRQHAYAAMASHVEEVLWRPWKPDELRARLSARIREQVSGRDNQEALHRYEQHHAYRSQCLRLIGHDLSNPLTAIRILAEMLSSELPSAEMRQDMHDVLEAADLATCFIESMSAMISMEDEEESLTRFLVDLRDVTRAAVQRPALRKRVKCVLPIDPVTLIGERYPLQQAITDMLLNARKLNGSEKPIELFMESTADQVSLVCASHRGNVPPRLRPRLLELFGAVDVRQHRIPVAAVGLGYAAHVAERHGGSIEQRDLEDGRFAFVLTLPLDSRMRYGFGTPE